MCSSLVGCYKIFIHLKKNIKLCLLCSIFTSNLKKGGYPYSAKPGFFHEDNRANLFEVEPESGMLLNTDNGSPMPQVNIITLSFLV